MKLGTHVLCAYMHKSGTDFLNFDFKLFDEFLNFISAVELSRLTGLL